MKIRVADYITAKLFEAGGDCVFLVAGGMIMHLTDALLGHWQQKYICCHHEQAAVMAAEAFGRYTGKLGVAFVTAGPGALNTLTGVVGAYVDSSPCIIVAGQSKTAQAKVTGPRQFALQGYNTLPIFAQVTKYAVRLDDISMVRYEVEKCIYLAKSHRVGPVWLECPIDIQGAEFDPDEYPGFNPGITNTVPPSLSQQIKLVTEALATSRRPCLLAGAGIRLAGAVEDFHQLIDQLGIPVLTSRLGMDLIDHQHPLFVGRPGTYGERAANFTVQNCDLLLNIGCRLGIGLVGYDFADFAPCAKKISVDIDAQELNKPSVRPDLAIQADAGIFIKQLLQELNDKHLRTKDDPVTQDKSYSQLEAWVQQTQTWKAKYPVDLPEYADEQDGINSYHFTRLFSEQMNEQDIFVVDTGSCFHVHAQAFQVKYGQRHIITGGLSTMGYLPGAIGVAAARKGGAVYCITGDGSIQMNLQELQTIVHNKLAVKILVHSNAGYLLIRHSQNNFLEGRYIGESKETGVSFPNLQKVAAAYGIHYLKIAKLSELSKKIAELRQYPVPVICEVMMPANQLLIPRVSSKKLADGRMVSMPYDDMFPFLPREEYLEKSIERDRIGVNCG